MPYSYNWVNKGFLSKFLAPPGCSKSHQLVTISLCALDFCHAV
jgi:hypothetical protein